MSTGEAVRFRGWYRVESLRLDDVSATCGSAPRGPMAWSGDRHVGDDECSRRWDWRSGFTSRYPLPGLLHLCYP